MKVALSLLVYNEGESIEQTILRIYNDLKILNDDFELWIMDNHSTDKTLEILERLKLQLPQLRHFRQSENVGYAMNTLSSFKEPKADIYVTMDGDGQFTAKDLAKMIDKLKEEAADIVVGWRVKRNDPLDRIIMNRGFTWVTQTLLGCKLHDLNCGYRVMTKKAADLISVKFKEKFVGPEIYARACQHNLRMVETPVDHFPRIAGESVYTGSKISSVLKMISYLWTLRTEIKSGIKKNAFLSHENGRI
ncbi:MAG TPA: glycosyltransferase family 2 protein [Pseudobdellovibrionaceae bacterium]